MFGFLESQNIRTDEWVSPSNMALMIKELVEQAQIMASKIVVR